MNKKQLIKKIIDGEDFKFQGFQKGVMSNWHPAEFIVDGVTYKNAEQFFVAMKAKTFGDEETYNKVIKTPDPKIIHTLGRQVRRFDEELWRERSEVFLYKANFEKYHQNPNLARVLKETQDKILVYCNPADISWGAGIDMLDSRIMDPFEWPGENKLGFLLMKIRDTL